MKRFLFYMLDSIREYRKTNNLVNSPEFALNRLESEIIRNVHSIEKGLCIENSRPGYGIKKIKEMFKLLDEYMSLDGDSVICKFVIDALNAYLAFQDSIAFSSDEITEIRKKNKSIRSSIW